MNIVPFKRKAIVDHGSYMTVRIPHCYRGETIDITDKRLARLEPGQPSMWDRLNVLNTSSKPVVIEEYELKGL